MKVFDVLGEYLAKTNLFISRQKPIILTLAFFAFVFIFFSFVYVQSIGEPRIDDHYFHLKYAYLLRTEGLEAVNNFDWIYFSGLAHGGGRYPVTLFNIMLIPFTFLSDMVTALKFVDVFVLTTSISIIYYSMKKMKVKYAFMVSLLLLSFEYMTLRFLLGRAFILVVSLVFLEVYFAVARKYKSLAVVSALHVGLHQATFFMPLLIVSVVEFSRYIAESKFYIKSLFYSGGAIIVAMMMYPGFPQSLFGMLSNVIAVQTQGGATGESIAGNELKKIDWIEKFISMKMLSFMIISNILVVTGIVAMHKKTKTEFAKFDKEQLICAISFFILSAGFLFGSIAMSTRFFDFLIPITVVLSALLMTMLFETKKIVISDYVLNSMKYATVIFFGIVLVNTVFIVRKNINFTDSTYIKEAAEWINERSDEDEIVFLYNWSDFSWMFFYNSDNVYTMGMEPLNLKDYDEGLYWKYYNIFKHHFSCNKEKDCKDDIKNIRDKMAKLSKGDQALVQRSNSNGVIQSVKNDFQSRFIVSRSKKFNDTILLKRDLIEDMITIKSDNGKDSVTVFMLK